MTEHLWGTVRWESGRWRGRVASQRLCAKCGKWETVRNSKAPCRGKTWEELTDQEKAAEFGGAR